MASRPAGRLVCLFGTWLLCLAPQSVCSGLAREPIHLRAWGEARDLPWQRLCTSSRGGALVDCGRRSAARADLQDVGRGAAIRLRGGWNGQEWFHRITDETIEYLEQTDLIKNWKADNTTEETRSAPRGDTFSRSRSCYSPSPSLPRSMSLSSLTLISHSISLISRPPPLSL